MRKVVFIAAVLLAGCVDVPLIPGITPYRIDVQQGNYVSQDTVSRLKPGMTRSQVRFLLGTPLVVDPFRTDRWDYVYMYAKGHQAPQQRRISVVFADDKLVRVEGDVTAGDAGATTAQQPAKPAVELPATPKP